MEHSHLFILLGPNNIVVRTEYCGENMMCIKGCVTVLEF